MVDRIPTMLLCLVLVACGDLGGMSASVPPPPPPASAAPAPVVEAPVPMRRAPEPVAPLSEGEEEQLLAIPGNAGDALDAWPKPSPAATPGAQPIGSAPSSFTAAGGAASSAWCCQYDGPLGKTQDLIDNPAECARKYVDYTPEFVTSPACVAVCCEYARDPADVSKGMVFSEVASGNCDMRRGRIVEVAAGSSCRDPNRPVPRRPTTRPTPAAAPPPPAPKYDPFRPKQR